MSKTIELTDLKVDKIILDYTAQVVKVEYTLLDSIGDVWAKSTAFFWVTVPADPQPKDFQLPAEYFPLLLQLRSDADAALTARFLV